MWGKLWEKKIKRKTYNTNFMDDRNAEVDINAVKITRGASDDGINHRCKKGKEREDPGPSQSLKTLITRQDQQKTTLQDNENLSRRAAIKEYRRKAREVFNEGKI